MAAKRVVLYFLLCCQISGIALFLKGFFPLKKNSPGFSTWNEHSLVVRSKFDRLIIVMIDALRADFVFGNDSSMSFTKGLISGGDTYSFQAHSNPPTVTMPRIKAITTGTIPGFIDVILNIDSKELSEDNIITQMKIFEKKIIFFGDDTWIKLFPNNFVRHDGTTSFFVADYTEVDNNVTRHVVPEMALHDWDVMILHYLGLDHIGHLAGPASPLVPPKLREMDEIIELIYKTTVKQDEERNISTLMMLCGDHGMSDGGSHGGSSSAETTTPLVFMSSSFMRGKGNFYEKKKINQIDIAPTLATLFGLSIPKNSVGILIPEFLVRFSAKERLEALRMNTLQISKVYESNTDNESVIDLDLALRLHNEWLVEYDNEGKNNLELRAEKISILYYSSMREMTRKLTKFMSSYDFYAIYIGIWLLVQALSGSVCLHVDLLPHDLSKFFHANLSILSITCLVIASLTGCIHVHVCSTSSLSSDTFCIPSLLSFFVLLVFLLSTVATFLSFASILFQISVSGLPVWFHSFPTKSLVFLIFGLLLHNISLLSTSFIEEEHQTWYFLTTTYHLIWLYKIGFESRGTKFREKQSLTCNSSDNSTTSIPHLVTDKTGCKTVPEDGSDWRTNHGISRPSTYALILLLCNRVLRSWNQTGIKWADQPDVADCLLNPENKTVLSLLVIFALLGITLDMLFKVERNRLGIFQFTIFATGLVGVYLYRTATGCLNINLWSVRTSKSGIEVAQFVHFCVFILVLTSFFQVYYEKRKGYAIGPGEMVVTSYILLTTLLLRTHNIPLVAMMLLQVHVHREVIWKRCESNMEIILSAYYIGWYTYFAQGNSNSLATVDIGAGYVGLRQNYWPVFVGLQTLLATFSGPLFWLVQAARFIHSKRNLAIRSSTMSCVGDVCTILLMIKSLNLTVCAVLSWLNCYHLFVWSVFSPKLLYEGVVSFVLGSFILAVSVIYKI